MKAPALLRASNTCNVSTRSAAWHRPRAATPRTKDLKRACPTRRTTTSTGRADAEYKKQRSRDARAQLGPRSPNRGFGAALSGALRLQRRRYCPRSGKRHAMDWDLGRGAATVHAWGTEDVPQSNAA